MKKYFLIFLLICANAESKTVIAKGFGSTREEALKQAKSVAIEMVTGSWINSESRLKEGKISTEAQSFTTGVVESFEIIERGKDFVVISASVLNRENNSIKDGSLKVDPGQIAQLIKNQQEIEKSFKEIDNIDKALLFKIIKIDYSSSGSWVVLNITGRITFQPKWINDYNELNKRYSNYKFNISKCDLISLKVSGLKQDGSETKGNTDAMIQPFLFRNGEFDFDFDKETTIEARFSSVEELTSFRVNFYCS